MVLNSLDKDYFLVFYLWLKHVTGVNPAVHYAHCLLGEYDPHIKANLTEISNITLPAAPYHYLC